MTDAQAQMHKADELTDAALDAVTGGEVKGEAQILQMLASAVNEVVKNLGSTLQTAARAG